MVEGRADSGRVEEGLYEIPQPLPGPTSFSTAATGDYEPV